MAFTTIIDPETGEEKEVWQKVEKSNQRILEEETKRKAELAGPPITAKEAIVNTGKAIPRMFVNAGINAVQEGSDTIRDIGAFFGQGEGTSAAEPDKPIIGMGGWKPETLESTGAIEDIGTGILQFGLEWLLLSKVLKGANWGLKGLAKAPVVGKYIKPVSTGITKIQKTTKGIEVGAAKVASKVPVVGKVAAPITAAGVKATVNPKGMIVDFAGFDQYEGRLYDLAANTSAFHWIENNSNPYFRDLLDQLKSDPTDSALEGRFKNAIEGWAIDFGVGSTASMVRLLQGKWAIENLAKEIPGSPGFYKAAEDVNKIEKKIQQDPHLARINRQITQDDRRVFDRAFAHKTKEWRDEAWIRTRESLGRPTQRPEFYHGTTESIQNKIRSGGFKESEGLYGSGIYITSNKTAATNWGGGAMRSNIDLEKFVDLGEFPKGDSNAINALYSRARNLRQEGKNILVRNHPRWGDLALVGRDFANIEFTKGRKVKVEGDLDSIRQQIDELGPEPTKPGKGQSRDASGKWTSTYRTWDKWNRRNKSLQARLQELEAEAPTKQVDEVAPEEPLVSDTGEMRVDDTQWYDPEGRPLAAADASDADLYRSAFMRRAQDIADGIETGDLPYFYGADQAKVDENVAAQVIEGSSISEIIESLKANLPKKTIPIGEAKGVTLSKYRGADKIIKRLKDQVGKQGFTRADRDSVEGFIDLIGHHMFDDVAFSFNNKIDAAGQFSFPRKLIEIRSKIIKDGQFPKTGIHELWHGLSRYLPAADVKRYTKEWHRARKKYIKSLEKKMIIEKGNPISPKESLKRNRDLQAKANTELKETGNITKGTQKELVRLANHALAYKELGNFLQNKKFTDANYRFKDVDEYFAEMLTDHFFINYKPVDFAPEGSFRRLVQEIGIFFKELWINVHAKLGGPNTEKIFNDYLKGRNNKKLRKYTLESYFHPDQVEGLEDGFRDMGIRINEAAQEFNIIEGAAFDDTFTTGTKARPDFEDIKGVTDEYNERLKKVENGEIDIDDRSLYRDQDVAAIRKRSKSFSDANPNEKVYTETTPEVEMLFDVIGEQFDRIVDTGLPKLNTRAMADNLINKFEVEGISLEALKTDEGFRRIDEFMKTNPEVVRHILVLRIALNVSGEKTAKLARQARNAEVNGTIDFPETMKSLHESLENTLAFSTQYRRWTRAAGQQLQSTQTFIDTSNIREVKSKTAPTFANISIDEPTAIKDLNDAVEPGQSFNNLPEEYKRAVETGEWTPAAQAIAWELTQQAQNVDELSGIKTIEAFTKGPNPTEYAPKKIDAVERVGKGLVTWRTSQLLSGMKTWGAQMSAIPRMIGEPVFNAAIELGSGNIRKANNYLRQYRFYMRYMEGALRIANDSYRSGVALYDPKIRTGAWIGDVIDDSYQQGRAYQLTERHSSYNLNQQPLFKEIKNSNVGRALDVMWKAGTLDLRGQQALETFQKSLAGNSLLHTVKFEEGLAMAERQIRQGIFGDVTDQITGDIIDNIEQAKYAFADQWAAAAVKHYTSDAVVNGVTIADAIMNDETALAIGRILTFTNEIRARVPERTYGFGEQLARERGMTDPVDIDKFAKEYRQGKVRNPILKNYNRMMKIGQVSSNIFDGKKKPLESWADVPEVGEFTPITTAGWSAIPSFWSSLQRRREGFIYSGIQPFNRSPGDMTKQYIRMTPGFWTTDTFYRDLLQESGAISNRWKGEVAIGSLAAGYFFGAVINNDDSPIEFTGYGPTSVDMRTMWDQVGRPPLSWRHRWRDDDGNWNYGAWRSYRYYEPFVTFVAGLADYKMLYSELTQEQRDNFGVALTVQLAAQVIKGRFNSSYYSGITNFVDTFLPKGYGRRQLEEGERSKFSRGVHRFFISMLPRSSHFREMTQAFDPYKRFVYDEGIEPIVIPSADQWEFIDKSNIKTGKDAYGLDVSYYEQTPGSTNFFDSFLNLTENYGRQFTNEMQKVTPGFSDELPMRTNWITGEPLINPGFLGSDQMPGDEAPWLFRLAVTGPMSIPGNLLSGFGIGTTGPKSVGGYPPFTKKNVVVMEELLKLSQTGQIFRPPTSNDFNGIKLSHPAFKRYKQYISTVTLDKYQIKDANGNIRPANLAEALHWTITKDPKYRSLGYINHPINPKDGRVGYMKKRILENIINEYKEKARDQFKKDFDNPYRMEVILRDQIRENIQREDELFIHGGPHPDQVQSGNIRGDGINAQQFTASINR